MSRFWRCALRHSLLHVHSDQCSGHSEWWAAGLPNTLASLQHALFHRKICIETALLVRLRFGRSRAGVHWLGFPVAASFTATKG